MGTMNATVQVERPSPYSIPSLASLLFGGGGGEEEPPREEVVQVRGCEVRGDFYEVGALVEEASGPCLECRYDTQRR